MYHPAQSIYSPDKARSPQHSVQSTSSWSSLPWITQHVQPQAGRDSPKFPIVIFSDSPKRTPGELLELSHLVHNAYFPNEPVQSQSSHGPSPPLAHPLLRVGRGHIHYDLANHPRYIEFAANLNDITTEEAFYPQTRRAHIRVPALGLSFTAENPSSVTMLDVLNAVYSNLHQVLSRDEFNALPVAIQNAAIAGKNQRAGNRAEFRDGLRRVDCLFPNHLFVGLSLATDGSGAWNLNTASRYH